MKFLIKNLSSFVIVLFIFSATYAQPVTVKPHQKVIDAFGSKHISYLQQNYPDSVMFYNFLLEGSFKILTKEVINKDKLKTLDEVKVDNSWIVDGKIDFKKFNILLVSVKADSIKDKYYKIAETENFLLIKSMDYNNKKFVGYKSFQK